jgi:hypothetical protein
MHYCNCQLLQLQANLHLTELANTEKGHADLKISFSHRSAPNFITRGYLMLAQLSSPKP